MERMTRRNVLLAGLAGAAATPAVLRRPAAADGSGGTVATTGTFEIDVAWLGYTTRLLPMPPMNPAAVDVAGAFRGWAVYMEGEIYDAGTIPGSPDAPVHTFDPAAHDAKGTMFGWGYVVEDLNRTPSTDPTLLMTVQYVFGRIDTTNLFPVDQLVSSGLEFAHTDQTMPDVPRQHAVQPVTGGAGVYSGANGVVTKRFIGTNTSAPDDGAHAARNYRLTFTL